jgi:hypothetical protein
MTGKKQEWIIDYEQKGSPANWASGLEDQACKVHIHIQ